MRRARIKAVATVPARRKITNNNPKDEKPESSIETGTETSENKKKTTEIISQCVEEVKEVVNKSVEVPEEKNEPEVTKEPEVELEKCNKIPETIKIVESEDRGKVCKPVEVLKDVNKDEKVVEVRENASGNLETLEFDGQILSANKEAENEISSESGEPKNVPEQENTPVAKVVHQTRTSFMRPTPRLDGGGRIRRNSVQGSGASASESEDDCRRSTSVLTNRVRNDSVTSLQSSKGPHRESSGTTNVPTNVGNSGDGSGTSPVKNVNLAARKKRKMNVSESARKLAEARREFHLKYEHKQPDRTKLTMYDLIYYNPVTNPIKKVERVPNAPKNVTPPSPTPMEVDEEEEEDCDTPEALPVPQVKVGPDGHLILDEQSLVIEHTGAKKNRQALARTEALVDDECNGSGFYKKRAKTRDWPRWETLKFYKALNHVGTDFLLMQSLFKHRTRQEIKMKFKKEERTNRRCIEKALTFHQEFDMESLKEDLDSFEVAKSKESDPKKPEKPVRQSKSAKTPVEKPGKPQIQVAASSSEESEAGGESDPEIYRVKPTRSGRLPKVRKLQAPKINTLDKLYSDPEADNDQPSSPGSSVPENEGTIDHAIEEEIPEKQTSDPTPYKILEKVSRDNCIADISQVEPGSLVIVSRESEEEPGETVLQVYMVSPDMDDGTGRNMMPVKLTPELLNTVSAGMTNVNPINFNSN